MKMKILPSRLDGFENYPDVPESTETLSPRVRAREKKNTKAAKSCVTRLYLSQKTFPFRFSNPKIMLPIFFEIGIVT